MVAIKRINAAFYESPSGTRPVREWLLSLDKADRLVLGEDIATVEFGWPIGMPVCRPLGNGLWEGGQMVLLHGFIKKTQKTPDSDLALVRKRLKEIG